MGSIDVIVGQVQHNHMRVWKFPESHDLEKLLGQYVVFSS